MCERICWFHHHSLSPYARQTSGIMSEDGRSNLIAISLPKHDSITRSERKSSWLRSVYICTVKYSPMYISLIQHSSINGWIRNSCFTQYESTWWSFHPSYSVPSPRVVHDSCVDSVMPSRVLVLTFGVVVVNVAPTMY